MPLQLDKAIQYRFLLATLYTKSKQFFENLLIFSKIREIYYFVTDILKNV